MSKRIRVRRQPSRGRYDRESIDAVLDGGVFCHLAFVEGDHPYCVPMLHARVGDEVYIHGSTASRLVRTLAAGASACLTVTRLNGLVLARSAFEHSANYESVMLHGRFRLVEGAEERMAAFEALTNKLIPGRWDEVRTPDRKEMKASQILGMPIDEAAVKARTGPPSDDDSDDAALETWAGVIPVITAFGAPEPSPGLRAGIPVPASVGRLMGAGSPAEHAAAHQRPA
jgi:nitroimidazol reductase NimA-like FMN-containing flavoprotein (pyridoxamine 5'-phosphate oxidase superfamily)